MKKIVILLSFLVVAVLTLFLGGEKSKKAASQNLDKDMAGPRGEEIFIGSGGGRYYLKNGKKIYVSYKGKKQYFA